MMPIILHSAANTGEVGGLCCVLMASEACCVMSGATSLWKPASLVIITWNKKGRTVSHWVPMHNWEKRKSAAFFFSTWYLGLLKLLTNSSSMTWLITKNKRWGVQVTPEQEHLGRGTGTQFWFVLMGSLQSLWAQFWPSLFNYCVLSPPESLRWCRSQLLQIQCWWGVVCELKRKNNGKIWNNRVNHLREEKKMTCFP